MGNFWTRLFDLIAPRCCVVCGARLSETEKWFCVNCYLDLPRTGYEAFPETNPMVEIFEKHFVAERVASWFYYKQSSPSSHIIHELKYHHQPEIGHYIGRKVVAEFSSHHFFDGINGLIPMPLTKRRERQRGYNQCLKIASGISEATGIPILDGVVARTRFYESQTHMSTEERKENVEGAFELVMPEAVKNRHVLVIDDVVTTGATMISLCKELLKVPSVRVSIFSVCFTKN